MFLWFKRVQRNTCWHFALQNDIHGLLNQPLCQKFFSMLISDLYVICMYLVRTLGGTFRHALASLIITWLPSTYVNMYRRFCYVCRRWTCAIRDSDFVLCLVFICYRKPVCCSYVLALFELRSSCFCVLPHQYLFFRPICSEFHYLVHQATNKKFFKPKPYEISIAIKYICRRRITKDMQRIVFITNNA